MSDATKYTLGTLVLALVIGFAMIFGLILA